MTSNGVSLRAVHTAGGWSSMRMVERYGHVNDAQLARAVRIAHEHTDAASQGSQMGPQRAESTGETASGTDGRKS
jgi:hypothetical protein